ncbi:MAG TPA: hypothetical protein VFF31_10385 [Blastocatellia bacterium]|nr:hypothetical protein [Blastocatellia bacterium]
MIKRSIPVASVLILFLISTMTQAQTNTTNNNRNAKHRSKQKVDRTTIQVQPAASTPVTGSGTAGQITKWLGFNGTSFTIGDSAITEDKFGNIGIGTALPTSKLTVAGMIQTTMGGLKFPDGTLQTTAFSPSQVVSSLNGLTGNVSLAAGANITITPSGNTLTIAASGALTAVAHDTTLQGSGTAASPLGVAVPLSLSGSLPDGVLVNILNTGQAGTGVVGTGGDSNVDNSISGYGVRGFGGKITGTGQGGAGVSGTGGDGNSSNFSRGGDGVLGIGGKINGSGFSGAGVVALGGTSTSASGGTAQGLVANGGFGMVSSGGIGVSTRGGTGNGAGNSGGDGIVAEGGDGDGGATTGRAGTFEGDVQVTGNLSKGGGSFKIDHPLDPENKYLYHSFVESPDMLNIYNGTVRLDSNGEAIVELPEWFGALNKDFRYSLTALGAPGPNLYIAEEVAANHFKIAGGTPRAKVSWTVTGIRQDAWANAHRIKVVEEKSERERGHFVHPELFSQPEEKSVEWARHPELMKRMKLEREQMKQKQQ